MTPEERELRETELWCDYEDVSREYLARLPNQPTSEQIVAAFVEAVVAVIQQVSDQGEIEAPVCFLEEMRRE